MSIFDAFIDAAKNFAHLFTSAASAIDSVPLIHAVVSDVGSFADWAMTHVGDSDAGHAIFDAASKLTGGLGLRLDLGLWLKLVAMIGLSKAYEAIDVVKTVVTLLSNLK
jgi:hypothetical protein